MKHPAVEWYDSPIKLPEGRIGNWAVEHTEFKPGKVVLLDHRESYLTGRPATFVKIDRPLKQHVLVEYAEFTGSGCGEEKEEGSMMRGIWMSDEPRELRQAAEWLIATAPTGKVLVGGLGLGVIATWLGLVSASVTVVEIRDEVVDLVFPHQRKAGYEPIRADLFRYLKKLKSWPYDHAFLDIWQSTGEATW